MRNLSERMGCFLNSNNDFFFQFKLCVYDSETTIQFEQEWQTIIQEFWLQNNAWLSHLYDIQDMGIPAYFRELFLGAVLRTTFRPKSEN